MFINELFTRVTQWEYTANKPGRIRASFQIDDAMYRVFMDIIGETNELMRTTSDPIFTLGGPVESFPEIWDITFSISPLGSKGDGYGEEDGIMNSGNAIAVFSTVIDIVQETVKLYNIQTLLFTADEPSRAKLYDRMSKQFVSKGWRYIDHNEIKARSDGKTSHHLFLLTKQPHPHSQLRGTKAHD